MRREVTSEWTRLFVILRSGDQISLLRKRQGFNEHSTRVVSGKVSQKLYIPLIFISCRAQH